MATYISDADLKDRLAAMLKRDPGELQPFWGPIIHSSNISGYNEIIGRLVARGYTIAQINTWSRRAEFNEDIGLFWCAIKGGGLEGYDDKFIARLDRREELDEVELTVDGEVIVAGVGEISTGVISTADDLFVLDPDDERRGEVTQW